MSTVGEVCHWALEEHIKNQWRWPRESDLVVDLVTEIRVNIGPSGNLVQGNLVERQDSSKTIINSCSFTPRVRTEVKLGGNGKQRIDLCLLIETPKVFFGKGYGNRNVVYQVDPSDVVEALEVKFVPHTQLEWLDDIIKLYEMCNNKDGDFKNKCTHLLAFDNSLEIGGNLLSLRPKSGLISGWPLESGEDIIIDNYLPSSKSTYSHSKYSFILKPINLPSKPKNGIFLWSLGVKSGQTPGSIVVVEPACWQLDCTSFGSSTVAAKTK